jgi:hypothetical protein
MAYYIVHKRNPFFKNGTIIELLEDGFQACEMVERDNRLTCVGNVGLIYPEREVFPYCIKMLRKGFDDPKLRRKSGRGTITPNIDPDELMSLYGNS